MDKSIRITVTGLVQGVGFRYFARRAAQTLGVSGWVRNRPDGSLEVLAEGDEEALHALVRKLREGPLGAKVVGVTVEDAMVQGFARFEVRM